MWEFSILPLILCACVYSYQFLFRHKCMHYVENSLFQVILKIIMVKKYDYLYNTKVILVKQISWYLYIANKSLHFSVFKDSMPSIYTACSFLRNCLQRPEMELCNMIVSLWSVLKGENMIVSLWSVLKGTTWCPS